MLVQEVRNDILREIADDGASSFSHHLAGVLQASHQEVSVQVNVLFDWVQKSVTIADSAEDPETCFPLQGIVLRVDQVDHGSLVEAISELIGDLRRIAPEHLQG